MGSLPPATTYRHPVEWLACRAKAATWLSHPALSDLLVTLGSSQNRLLSSEMAQLSFHRRPYENLTPGPRFHVCTSILLLSSLNNQNFCPV